MKDYLIIVLILSLLFISSVGLAQANFQGKLVAVNVPTREVMVETESGLKEYQLAAKATIKLNGEAANLSQLKPEAGRKFYPVEIKRNEAGQLSQLKAVYQSVRVKITEIDEKTLELEELKTGQNREVNLKESTKLLKNNRSITAHELKIGDQGSALFGFENQLKKLDLYHYREISNLPEGKK